MVDDFLVRAVLGGIGVALAAGPLGCFIVWRRMAYFGDTLAHSALLGVSLGVLLEIGPGIGILGTCLAIAVVVTLAQRDRRLATDTTLGLLAHGSLAIGMIGLSFARGVRIDLIGYLFGDVLAIGVQDLVLIWGGGAAVLAGVALIWRPMLAATVHEDLARAEGVDVFRARLFFTLLLAVFIAIAMKVVGVLLVTALLIIPAAAARRWSATPEAMAVTAALTGAASVVLGILGSIRWDTPTGPSIVAAALVLFVVLQATAGRTSLGRRSG